MSSLSWLGKTLCPPNCLVKSDIKAPSCGAIFRLGIVMLQCVRACGQSFWWFTATHIRIICPVCDITHVRKCTRPSPAFPYCKRRKAGRGPGNEARSYSNHLTSEHLQIVTTKYLIEVMSPDCNHIGQKPNCTQIIVVVMISQILSCRLLNRYL